MNKYLRLELISIICFILVVFLDIRFGSFLGANPQLNKIFFWIFLFFICSSFVILPAMILLSFRDKMAPGLLSYTNVKNNAGRLNRRNYLIGWVITGIVSWILSIGIHAMQSAPFLIFLAILYIPLLLFGLSITVRRLHDVGLSEYWILLSFIPLINFIMVIVLLVKEGTKGVNKYGNSPSKNILFPADLLNSYTLFSKSPLNH